VVVGAILRYPALSSIAPLCAYPVEWGPVLLALRIGGELLLLLLLLGMLRVVLGRYLRLVGAVLLEKGIEIVLVLLVRGGQMRAGPLLPLLRGLETMAAVVQLLLLLCKAGIALPDRLASPYAVLGCLLCSLVFLGVACESSCDAATERLLRLLDVGGRRLGLVGALTTLVNGGRKLGRAGLLLLLLVVL
jgi:hypothetical protein